MQKISELRKYQYDYHSEKFPYLDDWKRNPYSFLKSRFYMEASAVLVYFLQKTKIKPNSVTIAYGLAGIVGGILLAIPMSITHIIAVIIFFTKGILDWSDGHFARITGQTSFTGHILDNYGAHLNSLGLQIGLGFYVAQKTELMLFYYLIPLIPFFYTANLAFFSKRMCMQKGIIIRQIDKNKNKSVEQSLTGSDEKSKKLKDGRIKSFLLNFLDDRARTVDFICLLILIEMHTAFSVTWGIFCLLVLKQFLIFCGSFFLVVNCRLAEVELDDLASNINKYIINDREGK